MVRVVVMGVSDDVQVPLRDFGSYAVTSTCSSPMRTAVEDERVTVERARGPASGPRHAPRRRGRDRVGVIPLTGGRRLVDVLARGRVDLALDVGVPGLAHVTDPPSPMDQVIDTTCASAVTDRPGTEAVAEFGPHVVGVTVVQSQTGRPTVPIPLAADA